MSVLLQPPRCRLCLLLVFLFASSTPAHFAHAEGAVAPGAAPLWDYIIVGGGVAGCIVADLLSASGRRTLLLESGPPGHAAHGGRDIPPAFAPLEAANGQNLTIFDVPGMYHSIAWRLPQYNSPNTPYAYQANVLGGGGALNGALTMVPAPSDFDRLDPSYNWSYTDLDVHIRHILSNMQAENTSSADGLRYLKKDASVLMTALQHLNFTNKPLNKDPSKRTNTYNYPDVTAVKGRRINTCLRFLPHEEGRPHFKLRTTAAVERVVLGRAEPGPHEDEVHVRASGVTWRRTGPDGVATGSETQELLAPSGRVILAAGALNTPRLLIVSGIGPLAELQKLETVGLLPSDRKSWVLNEGVGAGLSDHVYLRMHFALPGWQNYNYFEATDMELPTIRAAARQYFESLSGPLAQFGPVLAGYLSSPYSGEGDVGAGNADIEVFMEASDECRKDEDKSPGSGACRTDTFDIFLMLLAPKSNTSLIVNSSFLVNARSPADVQLQARDWGDLYLQHPLDRKVLRWGIERIVTAMVHTSGDAGLELIRPAAAVAREYDALLNSWDDSHMVGNHWAMTCALGACTDPHTMLVHGLENVHVADASLLPHQVSSHPWLTVAAMARRSAQLILTNSGVAACASNPRCESEGMVGQCCPSFDATMLPCCQTLII